MKTVNVYIHNDAFRKIEKGWELHFQYCDYKHDDGSQLSGYRFIWKRPDGTLQLARGQARIPSIDIALELIAEAMSEGWGNYR